MSDQAIGFMALYVLNILVISLVMPAAVFCSPSVEVALRIEISARCRGGGDGSTAVWRLLSDCDEWLLIVWSLLRSAACLMATNLRVIAADRSAPALFLVRKSSSCECRS